MFCAVIVCIVCSDHLCNMAPKRELSAKDAPGKKKASVTVLFLYFKKSISFTFILHSNKFNFRHR